MRSALPTPSVSNAGDVGIANPICVQPLSQRVWSKRRGRRTHRLVTLADAVLEMNRSFKPHEHKKSYDSKYVGEALDDKYARTVVLTAQRRAGVILHPTSLPGPYGIGEIGDEAFRFVDWLVEAGMQAWQLLPLVPPEEEYWSPYSGLDALCGNVLLIALDGLLRDGLLLQEELPPRQPVQSVDYPAVKAMKMPLLRKAAERLLEQPEFGGLKGEMDAWRKRNQWVEESALFYALANLEEGLAGTPWWTWPEPIRFRQARELRSMREKHSAEVSIFVAQQFLWDRQWAALKKYANERNVILIGDMPIYVGAQSADVWAYQDLFELDAGGAPQYVSGVPPDAFSETGQLWGSPLYDWKAHEKDRYRWWIQRMNRSFQLHDVTRIDHFRGFAGYWAVEAQAETAMGGVWKKGPNKALFDALAKAMGDVPIIAEDLGIITPDVVELRKSISAPGMVVLQFAWGSGSDNVHLPHNHYENSVCYPGTHDNETAVGWWMDSATDRDKEYLCRYLCTDGQDIAWTFIRESYRSVSETSVIQMQDIMRLGNSARMNFPGTVGGLNWAWRIGESDVWNRLKGEAQGLYQLAATYDRLPRPNQNVYHVGCEIRGESWYWEEQHSRLILSKGDVQVTVPATSLLLFWTTSTAYAPPTAARYFKWQQGFSHTNANRAVSGALDATRKGLGLQLNRL